MPVCRARPISTAVVGVWSRWRRTPKCTSVKTRQPQEVRIQRRFPKSYKTAFGTALHNGPSTEEARDSNTPLQITVHATAVRVLTKKQNRNYTHIRILELQFGDDMGRNSERVYNATVQSPWHCLRNSQAERILLTFTRIFIKTDPPQPHEGRRRAHPKSASHPPSPVQLEGQVEL